MMNDAIIIIIIIIIIYTIVKFNLQLTVHKVHRLNNSLKFSSNTTEVGGSNDR